MNQAIKNAAEAGVTKAVCPVCRDEFEAPTPALKRLIETYGCAACRAREDIDLGLLKPC